MLFRSELLENEVKIKALWEVLNNLEKQGKEQDDHAKNPQSQRQRIITPEWIKEDEEAPPTVPYNSPTIIQIDSENEQDEEESSSTPLNLFDDQELLDLEEDSDDEVQRHEKNDQEIDILKDDSWLSTSSETNPSPIPTKKESPSTSKAVDLEKSVQQSIGTFNETPKTPVKSISGEGFDSEIQRVEELFTPDDPTPNSGVIIISIEDIKKQERALIEQERKRKAQTQGPSLMQKRRKIDHK